MVDQIRKIVENNPKNYIKVLKSKGAHKGIRSNEDLMQFILDNTLLLDEKHTLKTRLYWIINGIKDWTDPRVCCKNCGKPLKDENVIKLSVGYKSTCSKKCERKIATLTNKTTMMKKYGVENAFQLNNVIEEIKENQTAIQEKKNITHKKNNSFNTSTQEDKAFEELKSVGINVIRNYISEQYPFRCDFYLQDFDIFVELNFSWTHGGRFFDKDDDFCKQQLEMWKEKAKHSEYYKNAIDTWTVRDVLKKNTASENKLNYMTFWTYDEFSEWLKAELSDKANKIKRLKELISEHKDSYTKKLKSKSYTCRYGDLYHFILDSTPILDSKEYSFPTRVFWTLNNIQSFDDRRYCCQHCGKNIEHRNIKNIYVGYNKYCCKKCMHDSSSRKELYKEACIEHYGVENASQAQAIKDKKSTTSINNYGVSNPAKSHVVQEKIKKTNIEKYGVEYVLQSEDIKDKFYKTMIQRYGVEHALQSNKFSTKAQNTTEKHFGVKYPLQNREIRLKAQQKYIYDGIGFDSKPELALYLYLKNRNVNFEYQPDISYTYVANGKEMEYFPDFIIDGKVYEVKGRHFFKEDGTMQNPWCHMQDEIYEAKHQCMLKNNVRILLDDDNMITEAIRYVEQTFGKRYIEQFKRVRK